VELLKEIDGVVTLLAGPVPFEVKQLRESAIQGAGQEEIVAFARDIEEMEEAVRALSITLEGAAKRVSAMRVALARTGIGPGALENDLHDLAQELKELDERLNGNKTMQEGSKDSPPNVRSRLRVAAMSGSSSLYGPTVTQRQNLEYARNAYRELRPLVLEIKDQKIPDLEKRLAEAGAPWIEGQPLPER
jgi:hypothetical protein